MTVITFVIIAIRPGNTDDDAPMKDVFGSSVHRMTKGCVCVFGGFWGCVLFFFFFFRLLLFFVCFDCLLD